MSEVQPDSESENDVIVCDECGAKFTNTEIGIEALWSHCCQ